MKTQKLQFGLTSLYNLQKEQQKSKLIIIIIIIIIIIMEKRPTAIIKVNKKILM